ncbi:hypothetical protein F4703DRAFT_1793093 [Phycomyces blakesleeanus]
MSPNKIAKHYIQSIAVSLAEIRVYISKLTKFKDCENYSSSTDVLERMSQTSPYTLKEETIRNNPILNKTPPVFSGRCKLVDSWINDMKMYIHFHEFNEQDALYIIPAHLSGMVRVWYDRHIVHNPLYTSKEMYEAILSQFSPLS